MNNPHVRYERRDIATRYIAYFAGIAMALAILMHLGLNMLTVVIIPGDGKDGHTISVKAVLPPEPRLQENEAADLAALKQEESLRLNGYGWIDRKELRVHIPIDRAMDAIVQKGLEDWSEKKKKDMAPQKSPGELKPEAPK